MSDKDIYMKIAHHFGELRSLFGQLGNPTEEFKLEGKPSVPKCKCGLQAEYKSGVNKETQKPWAFYCCPKSPRDPSNCSFKEWA